MTHLGRFFLVGLILMSSSCGPQPVHPGKTIGMENQPEARDLYSFAETYRAKHGLPALGVGIVRDGKIIGVGVAGERKFGSGEWATLTDGFDIASCAKSVTATVAAALVEKGRLRWDLTVKDAFPEFADSVLPEYRQATLETFLRHRSGLEQWMSKNERWAQWHTDHAKNTATEKRRLFTAKVLKDKPRFMPGTETYYCNDGYLVAASMIEKATGKAWEECVREMLFAPLSLDSMRYGAPPSGAGGTVVWGHAPRSVSGPLAIKPDSTEFGDPPFGSPGGFLYASVPDILRYIDFHIQGENDNGKLLSSRSLNYLHTPLEGQQFALGWEVEVTRNAAGKVVERSIYHGGFSGRSRANMWFCPESRTGTVIVYNHGGDDKVNAYTDIFYALLREFKLN